MNTENQLLERNEEGTNLCESCEQREQLLDEIYEATSIAVLKVVSRMATYLWIFFVFIWAILDLAQSFAPFHSDHLQMLALIFRVFMLLFGGISVVTSIMEAIEGREKNKSSTKAGEK